MTSVVADMVEGVLVANDARDRDDLRARLLAAVPPVGFEPTLQVV